MGFIGSTYSTSRGVFDLRGVSAGDAAEMEARVNAVLVGDSSPNLLIEAVLTGVGEGPRWMAMLAFAKDLGQPRVTARAVAATGGTAAEAHSKLLERIAATPFVDDVLKVEIAGGGNGLSFMALAIVDLAV